MNDRYTPGILSLDEMETLVKTCYYREMAAIQSAHYQRSTDQANDMRACNAALAAAEDLLSQERDDEAFTDPEKEKVRQTLWEFVRGGLRNAIENLRNMTLRQQYIAAIKKSALQFRSRLARAGQQKRMINLAKKRLTNIAKIRHPDETHPERIARQDRVRIGQRLTRIASKDNEIPGNDFEVARLAKQAAEARNAALNLTRAKLSKTASAFSQWMKEQGSSFGQLRAKYTEKLFGVGQKFANLTPEQKVDVYTNIIESSGRANTIVTNASRVMGVMGAATLILILGCMVWDVVESSNPTLTAVQDAVTLGAGIAGAAVGAELGAAVGAAGGPLGVFVGGVLGGIIGGFGIGMAANSIFDAMVAAFSEEIPAALTDHSIWGDPIVYAPALPDGSELSTSLFPSQPL